LNATYLNIPFVASWWHFKARQTQAESIGFKPSLQRRKGERKIVSAILMMSKIKQKIDKSLFSICSTKTHINFDLVLHSAKQHWLFSYSIWAVFLFYMGLRKLSPSYERTDFL